MYLLEITGLSKIQYTGLISIIIGVTVEMSIIVGIHSTIEITLSPNNTYNTFIFLIVDEGDDCNTILLNSVKILY